MGTCCRLLVQQAGMSGGPEGQGGVGGPVWVSSQLTFLYLTLCRRCLRVPAAHLKLSSFRRRLAFNRRGLGHA